MVKSGRIFHWTLVVLMTFFFIYLYSIDSPAFNKVCSGIGFLTIMLFCGRMIYYYPLLTKSEKTIEKERLAEVRSVSLEIAEAEAELKELKSS